MLTAASGLDDTKFLRFSYVAARILASYMTASGKNILIADDDPAILESMQMMLELEGYGVVTTFNGNAIYQLKEEFPDLLLLDIWMSGEDGREICKYLKQNEPTKHIPIVMISASRDVKQSAKEAGADDFLAKPFEMNDLLAIVEKYVNARKL